MPAICSFRLRISVRSIMCFCEDCSTCFSKEASSPFSSARTFLAASKSATTAILALPGAAFSNCFSKDLISASTCFTTSLCSFMRALKSAVTCSTVLPTLVVSRAISSNPSLVLLRVIMVSSTGSISLLICGFGRRPPGPCLQRFLSAFSSSIPYIAVSSVLLPKRIEGHPSP